MAKRTTYQEMTEGLKTILKRRKISYKEVADHLGLAESSIKRLLNANDGQFSKIEKLCEWLGLSFSDLLEIHENKNEQSYILTTEQEALFKRYPGALQFYLELTEYELSVEEIKESYLLSEASVTFYLSQLERVGLIEVHAHNNVKNKIHSEVSLSPSGELAKTLLKSSMESIYQVTIKMMEEEKKQKRGTVSTGELLFSQTSAAELYREYELFNEKLSKVSARDSRLYPKKELIPYTYFNAFIPHRVFKVRIPNIS